MSTTINGHVCAYCGTWLGTSDIHWCEKMHPNWSPQWGRETGIDPAAPGGVYERIADVLERIADALESNQEREPS